MSKALKRYLAADVKARLGDARDVVVVQLDRLTVEKSNDLRGKLRAEGARMTVLRNRVAARAFEDLGLEGLDGVLDGLWQISEQCPHLFRRLEGMLGAQAPPLIDRHIASLSNADERVMRLEVIRGGKKRLVGGDERKLHVVGQANQLRLDGSLVWQPVPLDFHVEPVAEQMVQRLETVAGEFSVALGKG